MAIRSCLVNDGKECYDGKVFWYWEHNGYEDSDWYADVWDDENECVKTVLIGTTRCGVTGFDVEIDAADDVVLKLYRQLKKSAAKRFERENEENAKVVQKGDEVVIVKGRKVKKGTVAKCFWSGKTYNMYSRQYEDRIGIEVDGQKIFIAAENAFPINWEARLIHGKKRKEMIRKAAINNMYYCFRAPFVDNKPWRDRAKLTST